MKKKRNAFVSAIITFFRKLKNFFFRILRFVADSKEKKKERKELKSEMKSFVAELEELKDTCDKCENLDKNNSDCFSKFRSRVISVLGEELKKVLSRQGKHFTKF